MDASKKIKKINVIDVKPKPGQGVYVFQLPVRIWHWTIVCCIFALIVTGILIANPPSSSMSGDATYILTYGKLIRAHYTAGLILCAVTLWRICFAFWGNSVSRQIFIPHVWEKRWWIGVWNAIKWYLFIDKKVDIGMGHNPLAQAAMFVVTLTIIFMCLSGLGIYQAKGYSDFFKIFGFMENLAYALGGNGFDLVHWHAMGMIIIVAFIIVHFYMVVREDIMGRTTIISTMVSGIRLVKSTPLQSWKDLQAEAGQNKDINANE